MSEPRVDVDADSGSEQTVVPRPRDRVFLVQGWRERATCAIWGIARIILFRLSPSAFNPIRITLLRCFGAVVSRSSFIHPTVLIQFPWNLTIEENVVLEHGVILNCMGNIRIGAGTRISQYAHLCAGTHAYQQREMPIIRSPINIGRNVWIAADAFVGPGVTIGDGALLAARSSAFSNLPEGQICIGEPAGPRKKRFESAEQPTAQAAEQEWSIASETR